MNRLSLFQKILLAMLTLSLVPLLVSSAILALNLGNVRETLADRIADAADRQASESLRLRAEQVAEGIAGFLQDCEADLKLCVTLPRTPGILTAFYESRHGEVWRRDGTAAAPREVRESIPRYASLAVIDAHGRETLVIREGSIVPESGLRTVADPARTEFLREDYFQRARQLKRGEIIVTHVTGFHVGKDEQLAGAREPEDAYGGREFRGVIRFATPLFDKRGRFDGVMVLSLDHRLLMEFSQHISPGQNRAVVFPSYRSGNYAFIFDDEGWIITHPKFWDIRGVDADGILVPPYTKNSPPADVEAGRIPFNLDHAGFIHPNYPRVAQLVRERQSGYVDITNVGGAKKIMAFAPIPYSTGDYKRHGIFGGVTIGFQADQFHETARAGAAVINLQLREHLRLSAIIVAATSLMVVICAWLLSRGVTRPLALLTDGVRRLAGGESGATVEVAARDEVGELADTFNRMADELELRKNRLLKTLEELEESRRHMMDERNFKESVLESISSAIMTLSPEGLLTSINGTGTRLLGPAAVIGAPYQKVFSQWSDMTGRIAAALAGRREYGREPLVLGADGKERHFEVGFFPIYADRSGGLTVTIRDETEKESFREEMTRLDRLASLGKLAAGIAHEVRNPLTGVSLLLDDLHDRAGLDPESQAMMGKALQEIERVERLVAGLLNFSSPPKAFLREADLNRVIQDTLLLLRRECESRNVALGFEPGDVPVFRIDVEKVRQALLNLVKNALEAMPDGGSVRVATGVDGDTAVITVADTGPGIAGDDLPLIFEPFFTRKGAGTGLGLSITQRIVEEHHGRISVESSAGAGTTFTIVLPRHGV
ncbi:PAS domain-containing sensor histidine kinase [Geobacter anodireducens]|uniref:histidine kinase n=1 Tax=Geobacter soli TaxID=1510391 RepID=A0A0C1TQT3_9BACT|nr:PAS domain-containing sensor histidine kinase [Geobacter soli]ANA39829.1 histidine kinase [Geobacter anodireducens]KIE41643.1 histidine kinase [Geobacter soli]